MARSAKTSPTGEMDSFLLRVLALLVFIVGAFVVVGTQSDLPEPEWAVAVPQAVGVIALSLTLYVAGVVIAFLGRIVDATEAQKAATEEMLRRLD